MAKKLFFASLFVVGSFLIIIPVFAQVCPHIYEGINCGANWYCNGCQTSCLTCRADQVLNYVSCSCQCPSGKIECSGACVTPPTCSASIHRKTTGACTPNECGDCEVGYSPDPTPGHESPPNPCVKNAFMEVLNSGNFQVSGNITSTGGDVGGTRLCIGADCRATWPLAVSAFVQSGNSFGALAVLGTNDSYDLAIRTAGAEKMRITTGGNVGIGTVSPGTNLDVLGNIRSSRTAATASDLTLSAQSGIGYVGSMVNNVPIGFITNNTERVRIDTAGNVGIGTTNTNYRLTIAGTTPGIYLMPTAGSNPELDFGSPEMDTRWRIYRDAISDQLRFWGTTLASGDNWMVITNDGKVGIGTTSPNKLLHIYKSSGDNAEIDIQSVAGASHWAIYNQRGSDNSLRFWNNDITGEKNALTILNNGNVGIGTTAPSYTLDVSSSGTRAISGTTSLSSGTGVYGAASSTAMAVNYGGYFMAWGSSGEGVFGYGGGANGIGVYGYADKSGTNYGGYFVANGTTGVGVYAMEQGSNGTAVYGLASGTGPNYGGNFEARGVSSYGVRGYVTQGTSWAGYFTGGQGLYADAGVMGSPEGGYQGLGSLNATKICINGNCQTSWDTLQSVTDRGNTTTNSITINTPSGSTGLSATSSLDNSVAIFGRSLAGSQGSGVYGYSTGSGGYGVYGNSNATIGYGGNFYSSGSSGYGAQGMAAGVSGTGLYGVANEFSTSGTGVFGLAGATSGTNYGVRGQTNSPSSGWAGYFTGGKGVYTPQLCLGTESNCRTDWPAGGGGTIGGGGTASYLARFTGATTIGNSIIYDNLTNVGIGTITPSAKLDVNGTLKIGTLSGVLQASSGIVSGGATTTNLPEGTNLYYTDTRARAAISAGAGPVNYTPSTGVISFSSPLTIIYGGTGGTASPTAGAVAYGTGSAYAFTAAGTSGQFLKSGGTGTPTWGAILSADLPGSFSGFANPTATIGLTAVNGGATTAMRSDAASALSQAIVPTWTGIHTFSNVTYSALFTGGNVGIGTTGPNAKMDVYGTQQAPAIPNVATASNGILRIRGNVGDALDIGIDSSTPFERWLQAGYGGTVYPLALNPLGGNVGIGTTNPTTYKLYINGNGYLGASAWVYSSDRRLKENISYLGTGLDVIEKLKPAAFDFINGEKNQVGFIAQDVQQVLPNIVEEGTGGMLGIKTESIIPYLVKAIQEQQAGIDTLKSKNQDLEKRIEALEAKIGK